MHRQNRLRETGKTRLHDTCLEPFVLYTGIGPGNATTRDRDAGRPFVPDAVLRVRGTDARKATSKAQEGHVGRKTSTHQLR